MGVNPEALAKVVQQLRIKKQQNQQINNINNNIDNSNNIRMQRH